MLACNGEQKPSYSNTEVATTPMYNTPEIPLDHPSDSSSMSFESESHISEDSQTQHKTPLQVFQELSKKYKIVGVWQTGGNIYSAIVYRQGKYYLDGIDVSSATLSETDDVLQKISSKKYRGMAAYDMPEELIINSYDNLEVYVYNPDVDEWVSYGEWQRVF